MKKLSAMAALGAAVLGATAAVAANQQIVVSDARSLSTTTASQLADLITRAATAAANIAAAQAKIQSNAEAQAAYDAAIVAGKTEVEATAARDAVVLAAVSAAVGPAITRAIAETISAAGVSQSIAAEALQRASVALGSNAFSVSILAGVGINDPAAVAQFVSMAVQATRTLSGIILNASLNSTSSTGDQRTAPGAPPQVLVVVYRG